MAFDINTLATELENMTPVTDEALAIATLADAFTEYFYESEVAGFQANPNTLDNAKDAMATALVGVNTPGLGGTKIREGILAFWGIVAVEFATIWTPVPPLVGPTVPPVLLTQDNQLAVQLDAVFAANTAAAAPIEVAALNVATVINTYNQGGVSAQAGVPPTPVTIL